MCTIRCCLYYCSPDHAAMLKIISFLICFNCVFAYFTLSGKCPDKVTLQEDFRLADFYGKWYQSYHYSSDGQQQNNCSTLELLTRPSGIYLNQSRVDRGLFHRFSIGKLDINPRVENAARLDLIFAFKNAPRRLKTRRYPFHILATNYNYYATVYTCEYSPLIDKHFIYVWILSRNPILNDVSKELAIKPLNQIGVDSSKLVKDDQSKCVPKYYEDVPTEPMTFRFPVPI
ncbi:insecticyanin-A-like [Maniola hyperantus]|uniref:insecticyanin-A-like n=1 Tax=Aphantopus hyperantus TaxID=2795564 RepID=UPI0015691C83|nr:insecticyanin-A-like [Maniola hyperantus]